MLRRWTFLCCTLILAPAAVHGDFTTTFENAGLAANSYNNRAGSNNAFGIDGNSYNNSYNTTYGTWSGWALSSTTNTTDPNYTNQYSAITGGGAGGSSAYAVGFTDGPGANPFHPATTTISLAAGMAARSIQITNTTYAYLAMKNGDPYGFSPAFKQGDFDLLDIRGYDASGHLVNTVNFYLADYRSNNPANWTLVNTWQTVDLTSLAGATTLQFGLQSSQNDPTYGDNVPAYFAADNFVFGPAAVPEPSSLVLVSIGGLAGGMIARRRTLATNR